MSAGAEGREGTKAGAWSWSPGGSCTVWGPRLTREWGTQPEKEGGPF